jgi:ribosomal protein S6 kinase-like
LKFFENIHRFEPAVIEQRKKSILEFLYYCAENPVIYRSQCFVKFFENGNNSPVEEEVKVEDVTNSSIDSSDIQSQNNSIELDDDEEPESQIETIPAEENSFEDLSTGFDYLYDAAMSFSHAVQQEANNNYKQAFELYKNGIDKLLTGAKNDKNEKRKSIAKTKAGKYLERAESLYENHIVQLQEENFVVEDQTEVDAPSVLALERPVNNLSRFKVIAINNYLMRVQDCADKKFYILKNVYKDTNSTICLPQSIPFMVRLISYYKTENSIFLLFPLISGGLLWDYVNSYSNKCEMKSIEEIFVEPPEEIQENLENPEEICENIPNNLEVEANEEVYNESVEDFDDEPVAIPSFDTLSAEMDINDLMSCSLNLLQSVSKTLERSQIKSNGEKPVKKENFFDEDVKNEENMEIPQDFQENSTEKQENLQKVPQEIAQIPETVVKQWASELIVAVNSLHKAGIICGDLNLDNLLLGPSGHLTLTYFYQNDRNDFQQLCRLNPDAMKCHYVAFDFPLTKSSDWYSVGVLIYELMTRERFYLNHPMGIYRFNEIQYSNPEALSEDCQNVLHGLIIEKPETRLKYEDLVSHQFFKDIDWSAVEKCGLDLFKL